MNIKFGPAAISVSSLHTLRFYVPVSTYHSQEKHLQHMHEALDTAEAVCSNSDAFSKDKNVGLIAYSRIQGPRARISKGPFTSLEGNPGIRDRGTILIEATGCQKPASE